MTPLLAVPRYRRRRSVLHNSVCTEFGVIVYYSPYKTYSKEIHGLYKKITFCFLEEDELRKENPEL